MTVHIQKTSFIKVILIACAAFLLTGCRLEGTIDYRPGAKPVLSFEVEDTTGSMTELKRTCENVKILAQTNARFIKNPKVEDLTPPGGNIKCRVSSTEPMTGVTVLTEKSGNYYINIPKWKISGDFSDFKLRMTIIMPGKITKANTGKIEGNKVMIDDPNVWFKGISITAEKEGASNTSASSGESTGPSNQKTEAASSRNEGGDGFPAWGWGLVGGGVLAVIAGAWLLLGRKRRTAQASTTGVNQVPLASSAWPQQTNPYVYGPQTANPIPYPHNAQNPSPSGYGYNAPPTTPQAPNSNQGQDDPGARYRPR